MAHASKANITAMENVKIRHAVLTNALQLQLHAGMAQARQFARQDNIITTTTAITTLMDAEKGKHAITVYARIIV